MPDEMRVNDIALTAADIGELENADKVAHLFARLGYNVDGRTPISDPATLGIDNADMRQQITRIELLAADPVDEDIKIYLFEVWSLTAKLRNDIARRFRERPENALLVLTKDYEELEFVLLERMVTRSQSRGQTLRQVMRPIPLTVNRRNPEAVKLRVLKRFTFTEEDSAYQWGKLRSAYILAEWSEEYFNNRALFSDYYLTKRLTDSRLNPEWDEDVRAIGRKVYDRIITAPTSYTGKTEAVIRQELLEPLFADLGFTFEAQPPAASPTDTQPDYLLYTPGEKGKPIAAALTYVWNRNLDDVDTSRDNETPDEIPGAEVVSLLEAQVAPWVIVTNGKLWRLYSSVASNKATNYFEVDLSESIAATDQQTALKYWWLMFRRQAFEGFLDKLLKESADYAKALGDRLKDRVFVEIFPQFARGFITNMRAQGVAEADINLDTVFSGTMTFLYRMMFILYAESLELLPVSDEHGYGEYSLYGLKQALKNHGGENETDAPGRLKSHYKTSPTTIYERLKTLFGVINSGSADYNMPTYNGGLFSPENVAGRFLEQYAIPDQYLMLGLDRLTRDEDDKTKQLVFIDFKSLGVRHLGSIYEGLLEFRLKIASEALAVTKEKGREVYQPAKKVKKPLATLAKGDVYLENDKQERKATGSYYTPDYIVKYIVQHTVGPVLERKLKECEPRLRQAQKDYRQARELAHAKKEDPEKFWQLHEPTSPMAQLVDDCLNIRVLDPAMGSGHFLVEVVDFVSNKLIDFLNGWSENPVWAALEQTRIDILNDMERQHVSIDADRLTRVALLKRAVLKRCVYGVDLNAMAVELAKVSLWLDAFTLGAPLSFLDHHLKHGNSLIGARVADVQAALEGDGQLSMFSGSKFAGVMLATDLMRQVSYLSDNTIAQAEASKTAYHDARDHLAPFKRVLDVYTSRWFGNTPGKAKKGEPAFDPTVEFLKRDDTQQWLADPRNPKNRLPKDDYMKAGEVAKTALKAAEDKRFFHWELEFPEVFFAPSKPGGQDVQLKPDGGFDAVVGNPPYGAMNNTEQNFYNETFELQDYQFDAYFLFLELGFNLSSKGRFVGWIMPNTWLVNVLSESVRKYAFENTALVSLIHYQNKVFADATVDVEVVVFQNAAPDRNHSVRIFIQDDKTIVAEYDLLQADWKDGDGKPINIFLPPELQGVLRRVNEVEPLEANFKATQGTKPFQVGKGTPPQTRKIVDEQPFVSEEKIDDSFRPLLRGSLIQRYSNLWDENYWIKFGDWLAEPRYSAQYEVPEKIVIRQTGDSIVATIDTEQFIARDNLYTIVPHNRDANIYSFLAILNSHLLEWFYQKGINFEVGEALAQVKATHIRQFPIQVAKNTTPADERERLTESLIDLYTPGKRPQHLLQEVAILLDQDKSDVIHDFLAHLAQVMIDLNKSKQAEVKRFLGWLESKLKITPKKGEGGIDSLTGKTIIQGYLGDYQKGEGETPWRDFFYRLHQNRNRFAVSLTEVEGEIQREYENSLAALIPIKRDLARTDALIDKIVYRLYGLTDAEIELIERPGYEQALTEAKAQVISDDKIDDDEKIEKIAEGILPAAKRFFERVDPHEVEAALDVEIPQWRTLPPEVPTFLITADYNLRTLPEHMDFSSSVVPYAKAVEVVLHQRIFAPFRDSYSVEDTENRFLQDFMRREKNLTLGNYMIILSSSRERALRGFVGRNLPDMDGLVTILNDTAMRDIRNKAAHDEVLSRDEAQQMRTWALGILGMV